MHMQSLVKYHQFGPGNEVLTIIKGQTCVIYLRKLTPNNPNLDLVNDNADAILCLIPSNSSQYAKGKTKF